jgi:hypothetical protein
MEDPQLLMAENGKFRVTGFDPVQAEGWLEGDFLEQGLAFYVARRLTVRKSLPKAVHIETAVKYLVTDHEGNILGDGFESYTPGSRLIQPLDEGERKKTIGYSRANPLILSNAWKVSLHPSQLSNIGRCVMHRRRVSRLSTDHALAQVPHLMERIGDICGHLWGAKRIDFEGVRDTDVNRMQLIPRYERMVRFAGREFFDANFPGHHAPVCPTVVHVRVLAGIQSAMKDALDTI